MLNNSNRTKIYKNKNAYAMGIFLSANTNKCYQKEIPELLKCLQLKGR